MENSIMNGLMSGIMSAGDAGAGKLAAKRGAAASSSSVAASSRKGLKGTEENAKTKGGADLSSHDMGISNVKLRGKSKSTGNVKQTEKQQMTQALTMLIQKLNENSDGRSIEELASQALEDSQEEEEPRVENNHNIIRAKKHGMDNPEHAQFDPRFTNKQLPVPTIHNTPDAFVHDRHFYDIDTKLMKAEEVVAFNGGKTWLERCFPERDPASSSLKEPSNFYSPFPRTKDGDLNLMTNEKIFTFNLRFSLPGNLTMDQFVQKYKVEGNGVIELPFDNKVLESMAREELGENAAAKKGYHVDILELKFVSEYSNFGITMDKAFVSGSVKHPGSFGSWSTSKGADSMANCLLAGKSSKEKDKKNYYSPILPNGESNFTRRDKPDLIYLGSDEKNGAEYARWIHQNWDSINYQLKNSKTKDKVAYKIKLPHFGVQTNFDFLVWIVLSNIQRFWKDSLKFDTYAIPEEKIHYCDYFEDASKTGYTMIPVSVLDEFLAEKQKQFDAEKQAMRLENLKVYLWPLYGATGWKTLEEMAKTESSLVNQPKKYVQYAAELTMLCGVFEGEQSEADPSSED